MKQQVVKKIFIFSLGTIIVTPVILFLDQKFNLNIYLTIWPLFATLVYVNPVVFFIALILRLSNSIATHKRVMILFFISLILVLGSYFVINSRSMTGETYFGLCAEGQHSRDGDCIFIIGGMSRAIFWGFSPLLIMSIFLFFVRKEIFNAWSRFAVVAFPILLVVLQLAYSTVDVEQKLMDSYFYDVDFTALFLGFTPFYAVISIIPLFLFISLGIIFLKSSKIHIGLNAYIRFLLKYLGLAMIILPILVALLFFIWWFTAVVLGMDFYL